MYGGDWSIDKPAPAYFCFGEEIFPAQQFIDRLAVRGGEGSGIERFSLGTQSWETVLDAARTVPLFSSGPRLVVAEAPPRSKNRETTPTNCEKLTASIKAALRDYLEDPPQGTVLVILFPGKIRKNSALVKFFSSFPGRVVQVRELPLLKDRNLASWISMRLKEHGKSIEQQALSRLAELTGNDLRRIEREIEKLATYVGSRGRIELKDIDEACGWLRSVVEWELSDQLGRADFRELAVTLDRLIRKEGVEPVKILGLVVGFFRDILLAKLRLREGGSRKAIFSEIKPYIRESFQSLYNSQFRLLFGLTEKLGWDEIKDLIEELLLIDLRIKSTQLSFHILMEEFLLKYCLVRKGRRVTWRAPG
jgi:DNA polymerase III subunit delta